MFLLWIGAAGKVLLAQLDKRELKTILEHITLVATTPFTITDKKVFRQEIARTRKRGYATGLNDIEMGLADIAVPIEGYIVPASLAIIGPDDRLAPRIEVFVDKLKAKASKISQYLAASLNK
jgi:DNA-binding IclR family transcriptional regulator